MTGSRNWTDEDLLWRELCDVVDEYPDSILVEGGAKGADSIARRFWQDTGGFVVTVHADWKQHGPKAGPIRNQQMIDNYKPDIVVGFVTRDSKGTWDCLSRAGKAGIPSRIVRPEGE